MTKRIVLCVLVEQVFAPSPNSRGNVSHMEDKRERHKAMLLVNESY